MMVVDSANRESGNEKRMKEVGGVKVKGLQQQLVVFKLCGEDFGVDIMQVREIIGKESIISVPNAPPFVKGVINLRGQITTIIDLKEKLGLKLNGESKGESEKSEERVIVVEDGSNTVGILVDAVTEVMYLAESEIDEVPPMIKQNIGAEYLMGVGKLPDRLLILIDLKRILNSNSNSNSSKERESEEMKILT